MYFIFKCSKICCCFSKKILAIIFWKRKAKILVQNICSAAETVTCIYSCMSQMHLNIISRSCNISKVKLSTIHTITRQIPFYIFPLFCRMHWFTTSWTKSLISRGGELLCRLFKTSIQRIWWLFYSWSCRLVDFKGKMGSAELILQV